MKFHGREAEQIENGSMRVTVLGGGGHIAELLDKKTGVSPLWLPPWKSMEPADYDPARNSEYGADSESRLLAGIMGQNLCLGMFGPPSAEEAAAGFSVHGQGSVANYKLTAGAGELRQSAELNQAGLHFERILRFGDGMQVEITEAVENLLALDQPIAWTQHVTLGPPFLEPGVTRVSISPKRSQTVGPPAWGDGRLKVGVEFTWPNAPLEAGGTLDLSTYAKNSASRFTTHWMGEAGADAGFEAANPRIGLAVGYRWKTEDFPWLGIWEENEFRAVAPWNGRTRTWGMEFGASPFPETRRSMIGRSRLFGAPGYRWLPARSRVSVAYTAYLRHVGA